MRRPRADLSESQLHPPQLPETERDPFGNSVRFVLGEVKKEAPGRGKGGAAAAAGSAKPGIKETDAKADDTAPAAGKTVDAKKADPSAPATKEVTEVRTSATTNNEQALADLVLSATLVNGNKCVALINGRQYHSGDRLDLSTPILTVAEIHHHHVVLSGEGTKVDLKYSDAEAIAERQEATHGRPGTGRPKHQHRPGKTRRTEDS